MFFELDNFFTSIFSNWLKNVLKNFNDAAESLANQMLGFCKQTRRERIIQRNRTERLSEFLDWKNLGRYYHQARQMALDALLPEVSFKHLIEKNLIEKRKKFIN